LPDEVDLKKNCLNYILHQENSFTFYTNLAFSRNLPSLFKETPSTNSDKAMQKAAANDQVTIYIFAN
jgi:hypothetical protein